MQITVRNLNVNGVRFLILDGDNAEHTYRMEAGESNQDTLKRFLKEWQERAERETRAAHRLIYALSTIA
jgi:predicted component of type VI protein secretion system